MRSLILLTLSAGLIACGSNPPIHTVNQVDLDRFMGKWYVIANIPTFLETEAHNAVERYELNADGSIATTFSFREGGFDGPLKTYQPTGFVVDEQSNAVWDMQFLWPFKAEYRVIYLSDNYEITIIGRSKRDYVWLMARQPELPEAKLLELFEFIADQGYDMSGFQMVPQQWPASSQTVQQDRGTAL